MYDMNTIVVGNNVTKVTFYEEDINKLNYDNTE